MGREPDPRSLPSIAVATVTYNRCDLMVRLLAQLRELDYPADLLDVFVVDNASVDDTVERVLRDFPEVRLIRNEENLGVSAGFNVGIREALTAPSEYKYIWLLDSDAEVEPSTLLPLVRAMEADERIGLIGSAVYDPGRRDRLVTLGLRVDWRKAAVAFCRPGEGEDSLVDVELIPACSSLTRSHLCRKLGLWDERFWLYWGDTDWCARVLRDGHRVCCLGESRVWHRDWAHVQRDFTAPFVLHDDLRGGLLFNLRHNPDHSLGGVRRLMLKSTLKAALENLTMRPNFGRAQEEAIEDFLAGRFEKRDPSYWAQGLDLRELDALCEALKGKLPERPRILLNQIDDPSRAVEIRETFSRHFPDARSEEMRAPRRREREDLSLDVAHYLTTEVPQLVLRLFGIFRRYDVVVSDVAAPHLYNLVAAGHTVLLNSSGRGMFQENRRMKGFARSVTTVLRGLKRAYFDLPRAVKRCDPLMVAASEVAPNHPAT